jgi:hypothetical protein
MHKTPIVFFSPKKKTLSNGQVNFFTSAAVKSGEGLWIRGGTDGAFRIFTIGR